MSNTKKPPTKKPTPKKATKGVRYTAAQKAEIVKFVNGVNATKGRGGVAEATRKYKISPITINNWLKKASGGNRTSGTRLNSNGKASGLTAKLNRMAKVSQQIEELQNEFNQLKASL